MLKKIGRLIYYNLFLLTPLLVLSSTSELFEFNKMNFIYFCAASITFLLSIAMIRAKKLFFRRSVFDISWLVFIAVMFLSLLFSIDKHVSFFGYYGRFNGGVLSLIAFTLLFYGFGFFFSKKDIYKILTISIISSLVVMIWGLSGKFGHDFSCLIFTGSFDNSCWTNQFRPSERMFSTLGQPNWLGAYLGIHFFLGLFSIVTNHFKRWYLNYGYVLLTFICLLSTKSRSALLGIGIGFIVFVGVMIVLKRQEFFKTNFKKLFVLGFLAIISIVFFKTGIDKIDNITSFSARPNNPETTYVVRSGTSTGSVNDQKAQNYVSSEVTESLDIRKIVWKGAIDLGLRYPLLGTGPETFAYSYYFTRPVEHNLTSEWDYVYNKAHNEYLNYFATTGFIGLITYLTFVSIVLWSLFRVVRSQDNSDQDRLLFGALLCAYIVILVTNFFGFSTSTINIFFFLIPAFVAIIKTHTRDYFTLEHKQSSPRQKIQLGFAVLGYLFCLSWLTMSYLADTQYAQALTYEANGDYIKADKKITTAALLRSEPIFLDKRSHLDANISLIASYQNEEEVARQFMSNSQIASQKALRSSPRNIQFWKTSAKNNLLYYQITLDKKYLQAGIESVQTAMKLAPTEAKLPYTEALLFSVLEDDSQDKTEKLLYRNQSISSAKQAVLLKPNYEAANVFLQKMTTE